MQSFDIATRAFGPFFLPEYAPECVRDMIYIANHPCEKHSLSPILSFNVLLSLSFLFVSHCVHSYLTACVCVCSGFHGSIPRGEAVQRLYGLNNGTWLLRLREPDQENKGKRRSETSKKKDAERQTQRRERERERRRESVTSIVSVKQKKALREEIRKVRES